MKVWNFSLGRKNEIGPKSMAFSDLFFILEIIYPRKERTSYGLLQNIARHLVPCLIRLAMFIYRFTLLAFELNYCSAITPTIKQAYNLILYFYPLSAQFRFYRRGEGRRGPLKKQAHLQNIGNFSPQTQSVSTFRAHAHPPRVLYIQLNSLQRWRMNWMKSSSSRYPSSDCRSVLCCQKNASFKKLIVYSYHSACISVVCIK